MRIVFAGTPAFAVPTLEILLQLPRAQAEVVAVYTQPDRPAGRGRHAQASFVKSCAIAHDIPVYQPLHFKSPEAQHELAALQADLMIVVAYGLLLPPAVLAMPRLGCVNLHASLLPRWRGAAPIQYAILHGDTRTGITLMQMDKGLDTGAMLATTIINIGVHELASELHDRLAISAANLLHEQFNALVKGQLSAQTQDDTRASYAHKIQKNDAWLDWQQPANTLANKVRAFNAWPVAQTLWSHKDKDETLRIWQAQAIAGDYSAYVKGSVIKTDQQGIWVATADGALLITQLQRAGGKPLLAQDFVNAFPLSNTVFHSAI